MPTSSSLAELHLERKQFRDRSQIKPWLNSSLLLRGVQVAIERSDVNKIIFKCRHKAFFQGQCPFRIRANYLIKMAVWLLVVINDSHNHDTLSGGSIAENGDDNTLLPGIGTPAPVTPVHNSTQLPTLPSIASPSSPAKVAGSRGDFGWSLGQENALKGLKKRKVPPSGYERPSRSKTYALAVGKNKPKKPVILNKARITDLVVATMQDTITTEVASNDELSEEEKRSIIQLVAHQFFNRNKQYFSESTSKAITKIINQPIEPLHLLSTASPGSSSAMHINNVPPSLASLISEDSTLVRLSVVVVGNNGDDGNDQDDQQHNSWSASIPLLPLLNETEADYSHTYGQQDLTVLAILIENLIHMPGASGGGQPLLLPPFNSFQSKLTLLPTMQLPTLSAATMNPLHLLKPNPLFDHKGPAVSSTSNLNPLNQKEKFDFNNF